MKVTPFLETLRSRIYHADNGVSYPDPECQEAAERIEALLTALRGLAWVCDEVSELTCVTNEPRTCRDNPCNHHVCGRVGCLWKHMDNARVQLLEYPTTPPLQTGLSAAEEWSRDLGNLSK